MNIYQTLWAEDENKFSVSRRLSNGEFENPTADILLDEQRKANGKPDTDLAKNPLFKEVNKAKLQTEINSKFIKLLNNYVVNFKETEEYSQEEMSEIDEFIETIRPTRVWQTTVNYIEHELNYNISGNLHETIFNVWCKLYTNWYNQNRIDNCSGFEHVFVGEGKLESKFVIDGYHNWIKFLLDEKTGRVNYLGYNYGINNGVDYDITGPTNPNVVTLQMVWDLLDLNGNKVATLFKPKGGFFVGTSPECDLAMGTIAYFESKSGLFTNNRKEVDLLDFKYDLVLYRNTNQDNTLGDFLRSFYPEFKGEATIAEFILKNRIEDFDKRQLFSFRNNIKAQVTKKIIDTEVSEIYFHDNDWRLSFENWKH